jgi:hypothetical protein
VAVVAPLIMIALARVSAQRWAATILATFYTVFMAAMVWLFPLFHAEPKLGPVYQQITHFIPLEFPLMLIPPAIAIDVLRHKFAAWPRWKLAPVLGAAFLVVFVTVEWPFAAFMQTPAAGNAVFGGDYFAYFMQPGWAIARHEFFPEDALATGMAEALVLAIVTSWIGLRLGDAMRSVRR